MKNILTILVFVSFIFAQTGKSILPEANTSSQLKQQKTSELDAAMNEPGYIQPAKDTKETMVLSNSPGSTGNRPQEQKTPELDAAMNEPGYIHTAEVAKETTVLSNSSGSTRNRVKEQNTEVQDAAMNAVIE